MSRRPHRGAAGPQAVRGVPATRCRLTVDRARADAARQLALATNLHGGPCRITHSAHSWPAQIIQFRTQFKRSAEHRTAAPNGGYRGSNRCAAQTTGRDVGTVALRARSPNRRGLQM